MTLREALRKAADRLEKHHVSSPRLNAEVIFSHCLRVEKTYLYTHDRALNPDEEQRIEDALHERISGVPVQYIVGRQEFFGRYFNVSPSVLIPRPETEFIVEAVLSYRPAPGTKILDVGTGSGCIGITLALELPETRVTITDVSMDALEVARANAVQLGANVTIACMDLLEGVHGPFDFIVSNPPYISPREASRLQTEVREHEPHVALFSDDDGAGMFRRLIPSAERELKHGGYLILEIGAGLEKRVLSMFSRRWKQFPTKADLQGIPRTITAQRI
jgi:release factor glutamine methyltransferase